MLKRISYLASVSILTSVVMGKAGYAVHEEELGKIIMRFNVQPKSIKSAEEQETSKEEGSSWWGYADYLGSALKPAASGMGNLLRWGGDQIRGGSVVGDILTENGIGIASQYGGSSATAIIDKVNEKEGSAGSARQTFGNSVRWLGSCLVEETETLERSLRQFWIDTREADDPEQALTSTACALYLSSSQVGGVDGVKISYRKFIKSWNSSSYTVHSEDAENNQEYFLKGLIRGFVKAGLNFENLEQNVEVYRKAFNIDYDNLSVTKIITADSVLQKGEKIEDVTIGRIKKKRQKVFKKFVKEIYQIEENKLFIDQAAPILMLEGKPKSSLLAIQGIVDSQEGDTEKKLEGKENKKQKGKEKIKEKGKEKSKKKSKKKIEQEGKDNPEDHLTENDEDELS